MLPSLARVTALSLAGASLLINGVAAEAFERLNGVPDGISSLTPSYLSVHEQFL